MKQFKSYTGMAAVCAMLSLASCSGDIDLTEAQAPANGQYKVILTASQEGGATRTALSGTDVVWQSGDAITVFDGAGANCTFELSNGEGETTGEFAGAITVTEPKEYCAVYPQASNATIDLDYGISGLTLPVEQVATPDGFDPQAAIMTARNDNADKITSKTEDLSLGEFKHVCAFVKVTTTETYDKITFTANGGEGIAGAFTAYVSEDGISTVAPDNDASATVSLVPADGSTKIAAGTYLIAVLPNTLSQGFTITCVRNGDANNQIATATHSFNNAVGESVFSRRNVVNMGTANATNGWTYFTPTYVDLGLSVKWATCNVGATSPEGYGDYFAWGETSPKNDYSWSTYKFNPSGDGETFTKYTDSDFTVLEPQDDDATVNWGGAWRMPTHDEQEKLLNGCYWEWTTDYNGTKVGGFIVYKAKDDDDKGLKNTLLSSVSPKATYNTSTDAHIFLPFSGWRKGSSLVEANCNGYYWSATHFAVPRLTEEAHYLGTLSDFASKFLEHRYYGMSVRPVLP